MMKGWEQQAVLVVVRQNVILSREIPKDSVA
jgi:hypothetical protein